MKSQRLCFEKFGQAHEVIRLDSSEMPALALGQVLLKILASPINPADLNLIEGTYGTKPELPATTGIEGFAEVLESKSPEFEPGDFVIPISHIGTWSSHVITSAEKLIKINHQLDPSQGAMLKVNPATAKLLLENFGKLQTGDIVAFNAANSGVGRCLIQLAKLQGIQSVCFLRNTDLSQEMMNLGASFVAEDSKQGLKQAMDFMNGKPAKNVFNAVGGDSALRLMRLLEDGGNHITYGAMGRKPLTVPNGALIFQDFIVRGLWVTRWISQKNREHLTTFYNQLATLVARSELTQKIDTLYPLAEFQQAFTRVQDPQRSGKVLFTHQ